MTSSPSFRPGRDFQPLAEPLVEDDPEKLYDRAPCGYLSTLPDGRIIKVNRTFLSLTGYTREELAEGTRFADLLTPGGRIYHETHYAPMLQMGDEAREIAFEIVRSDGRRLPVLVNASLERDEQGRPRVVRVAVFDATERREYERELLLAKRRAEESENRAILLARTLQQTLIPHQPPEIAGLRLSAVYRPAGDGSEVGGDFYDIFETGADECVVVVGDVQGKGAEAAAVTALVRHAIRAAAVRDASPRAMLELLNQTLLNDGRERFCTVAVLTMRRAADGWEVRACAAGHPLPLLVRSSESPLRFGNYGTLLGVMGDPPLEEGSADLKSGDLLVLYTDGITEARSGRTLFGDRRLRACVSQLAASQQNVAEGLLEECLSFQSGVAGDDIVVVAVQVDAGPKPHS